jgi:predicted membrane channel-forming protein YqfA (hemolysin III family)
MKKYKLLSWSAIIISIFLLILPRLIPICDGIMDGHPMECHYTYQAEFVITLLAVIISASLLVLRSTEARSLAGFVIVLLGISIIVLPQSWAIGICENGACGKTTFFATIAATLLAIAGAGIVWSARNDKND